MRLAAFFKLYKMCILLHRCNLKFLAKNRYEKSVIFVKNQQFLDYFFANVTKVAKIQNFQLDNQVEPDEEPAAPSTVTSDFSAGMRFTDGVTVLKSDLV